jgi:superfamily II DNA or RNA helicase
MNEIVNAAEARHVLLAAAKGRFGKLPAERIVEHVLQVTDGADWPVQKAALEALKRRFSFAQRDAVSIAARPAGRELLGTYRVARKRSRRDEHAGYDVALLQLEPLRVSCNCADFARSSLGLCKHALVVLAAVWREGSPRRGDRATLARPRRAVLTWSPIHPLTGAADRLARLELVSGPRALALEGFVKGKPAPAVLRDPKHRLSFIAGLERALQRNKLEAEPAAARVLAEEHDRARERSSSLEAAGKANRALSSLKRKLYPYQRKGVQRLFERGRLLLADDMGLGKTTQAIAACHGLLSAGAIERGLLIVPAALKSQWKREWDATTPTPLGVVEGGPEERSALYARTKRGFLIIGYEQLLRDFEAVARFAPDAVVLDEAQRIKNWATKSAAYVKALAPRYRLVLTGTPMENRFDELASIMDFVDDVALEPKWRLVPWHSVTAGDGGRGMNGARNLDTLRARLSDSMLRRVRKDVLSQLPSRTDTRVPVELTAAQQVEHDELRVPISRLLSIAGRRALTQGEFLRLMQLLTTQRMICNGLAQVHFEDEWPRCVAARERTPALLESLSTPKLAVLRGLVEQVVLAQGRKAVVFSQWRNMLRLSEWAVRDLLERAGQRAVFFTGAESSAQRERSIIDLHDDPAVTMMFLSDAGGVGLNLQRAATCCINLELPWNPAVLEQRIGRIYRLGQTHPIDVYNLVADQGIEARIAQLVADKKAVFTSLFDGTTDSVRFDGAHSFLEGVKKIVDAPELPDVHVVGASEDAYVDGDLEPSNVPSSIEQPPPRGQAPRSIADGLAGLSISTLPTGAIRIDAPPELAAPLASMFEALARSLRDRP